MLVTTTTSEHIDHWIKMRRSLARFSGLESSVHTRYSADFIITTSAFRFSVHTTGGADWNSGSAYAARPNRLATIMAIATIEAILDTYQTRATRSSIQVSRKAREKLSKTGFMMYSKNVRSPVLM